MTFFRHLSSSVVRTTDIAIDRYEPIPDQSASIQASGDLSEELDRISAYGLGDLTKFDQIKPAL